MVDYSKWKDIEVSDDEDETHPNIDTPSLFRWRREARLKRMEEMKAEKQEVEAKKKELEKKKREAELLKTEGEDVGNLMKNLSMEEKKIKDAEEELVKKERITPWNVDTIGKDGFSKTVINRPPPKVQKEETEEQRAERFREFKTKNEKLLKEFGMIRRYEDSKKFLLENPHLACEDTANYLTYWCIGLALEDKFNLMNHVSHQAIAIQFLLELSKQVGLDPRVDRDVLYYTCISSFFSKMVHVSQTEYKEAFDTELKLFQGRIRKRAEEKIAEAEEEERKKRLGPGGLDPFEVIETLPEKLRKCFETQDIPMLHTVINEMPREEAEEHIKRCVASGLWVPNAKDREKWNIDGDSGAPEEAKKEPSH